MKCIYDLNDVFCAEKSIKAIKQEIINILESSKDRIIDIESLFKEARKNIVENIIENYLNNCYQDDTDFSSEAARLLDECFKKMAGLYDDDKSLRISCNRILNSKYRNLEDINKANQILKEINKADSELDLVLKMKKHMMSVGLTMNSPIESLVFCELDNGKYGVEEWIKPYLDRIKFYTLDMHRINIEDCDFTGTSGITISSDRIEGNTLSNTVLNGATIKCYRNGELYAIDPNEIDITGADFTGSKGAIVTLENVDEMPEKCNLTDALIVVNSKDDVKRFNLDEYKKNIYIKQDSIVYNNEMINYDINDYINYSGTIDTKEMKYIDDALRLDGFNDEKIRAEYNKIISYLISSDLAAELDFKVLYNYFVIFRKTENFINEHPEVLKVKDPSMLNIDDIMTLFDETSDNLYAIYDKVGNPFYNKLKYTISGGRLKIFTHHGVLTIDLLGLGLSQEDVELALKGKKVLELPRSIKKSLINIYNTLSNCVEELDNEEENTIDDKKSSSLVINFSSMYADYKKSCRLEECFINTLENIIYKNLDNNNKGYSNAIKKIKTRKI